MSGTLESIDLKAHKIVLVGGFEMTYDDNDLLYLQHFHDVAADWHEDGDHCELRDAGCEEEIARFAADELPAEVDASIYRDRGYMQIFHVVADTCDGVVDAADMF